MSTGGSALAPGGEFGPPEPVLVEREWLDGPRAGLGLIGGELHRFVSQWSAPIDDALPSFVVWPVSQAELLLEQEQWQIFTAWNEQFEAGRCPASSHPALGGRNARWDELEAQLGPLRTTVASTAPVAHARLYRLHQAQRYGPQGPDYWLAWRMA